MEWLVDWLKPRIPGMRIVHLGSGEAFDWV
jgi:hypothetical protein